MNLTELSSSVRPEIIRATQAMGYTEMTEIQQKAIPLMLAGHDMIAKAPTGTAVHAHHADLRQELRQVSQILCKDYKRVMVFCNTKNNTGMLANS